MVERVELAGRHVVLQPMQRAHVDGLLAAASEGRATYAFTLVPHARETTINEATQSVAIVVGRCQQMSTNFFLIMLNQYIHSGNAIRDIADLPRLGIVPLPCLEDECVL